MSASVSHPPARAEVPTPGTNPGQSQPRSLVRLAAASARLGGAAAALLVGFALATVPAVASAQTSRTLDRPGDWQGVVLLTVLAVLGLAAVATLGYLYLRERGTVWDFQRPDDAEHH